MSHAAHHRRRHFRLAALALVLAQGGAFVGCGDDGNTVAPRSDGGAEATTLDAAPDTGGSETGGVSCKDYCANIVAHCAGESAQYPTEARCAKVCALLPAGTSGEQGGVPTVACRAYHAGAPALADAGSCAFAGPYGGGVCGDRCDSFCILALGQCDGTRGPKAYKDFADCKDTCEAYPKTADKKVTLTGPSSGNTRECRAYYLQLAFDDPAAHCAGVAAASAPCGSADAGDGG